MPADFGEILFTVFPDCVTFMAPPMVWAQNYLVHLFPVIDRCFIPKFTTNIYEAQGFINIFLFIYFLIDLAHLL